MLLPTLPFDRVAAVVAALAILGLSAFLLVRNQAIADPALFFALRVLLSFGTAVLGATIPGFLNFKWSGSGLVVRAGGALALFALTYLYTPTLKVAEPTVHQEAKGNLSPPIVDNKGTIIIGGDHAN